MKKSQTLAALALAFALGLGVIAPVANTYAQITPNEATQEQKDAIYDQAQDALNDANALANFADYENLYNNISKKDTGLIDVFADKNETIVDEFNDNSQIFGATNSINAYINTANSYLNEANLYNKTSGNYTYIKADKQFSPLKSLTRVSKANTVKEAYDAISGMLGAVEDNISTLENNYKTDSDIVNTAKTNYESIQNLLNGWLTNLGAAYQPSIVADNLIQSLADDIKDIDESVYNNLTKSAAWKNVDDLAGFPGLTNAMRAGLIINTAKSLPKYNYVNAVVEAKADVEAVLSSTTDVSYANAKKYIAALNNAVEAYETGKAPVTPTDPDTKPGDEDKDPTAPDTGIVAAAEGDASTTVAMVAGIATALTAAGAGVVAYRNARRSTRK